mmetsp:Transcript_68760/g.194040  ORF Transcript_68760/g.194040 Transcript_68760/m.194040 type:complete len:208 (-) Transcript_68760:566-1189(-)
MKSRTKRLCIKTNAIARQVSAQTVRRFPNQLLQPGRKSSNSMRGLRAMVPSGNDAAPTRRGILRLGALLGGAPLRGGSWGESLRQAGPFLHHHHRDALQKVEAGVLATGAVPHHGQLPVKDVTGCLRVHLQRLAAQVRDELREGDAAVFEDVGLCDQFLHLLPVERVAEDLPEVVHGDIPGAIGVELPEGGSEEVVVQGDPRADHRG